MAIMPDKKSLEEIVNKPISGADILIKALEREGIRHAFAYPGGASMPIHQALTRSECISVILPRHEQAGSFMANGYSRASGKPVVCIATSGPGGINLLQGIVDAHYDSIAMLAITGQVPSGKIGQDAFQETPIFGMTLGVTKHNYLVFDTNRLARTAKEAVYISRTGRPGPVLMDIPKDMQLREILPEFPGEVRLRGYNPNYELDYNQIKKAAELIRNSKKPFIYAGGGIITSGASKELREFAELLNAPVGMTVMGLGGFPAGHPLCMDMVGMHGSYYSNYGLDGADLLIVFGARFDDRVTGDPAEFAKKARIIHNDIDYAELGKIKRPDVGIQGDAKMTLKALLNELDADKSIYRKKHEEWLGELYGVKEKRPFKYKDENNGAIMPQYVLDELSNLLDGEGIVTVDVGQHQMFAAQFVKRKYPRTFLSSSGLGAMGFGFPAAIGAKVAMPDKEVINISGDGGFLMNIQELATLRNEKYVPGGVKAIILNNQHLGMVAQWEDLQFRSNRAHTELGDVDFKDVAMAFRDYAVCINKKKQVVPALKEMLDSKEDFILECKTPYKDGGHVLPMIPAGKSFKEIIYYDF